VELIRQRRKDNVSDDDTMLRSGTELRLLGLDVGDRRIGVAVSDPTGSITTPIEVYQRREPKADVRHVTELMTVYGATSIVVGLPKT
jgi:RNase H-fold protein (predicted Holliday junction resolvase)